MEAKFFINDVYDIYGIGTILVGTVKTGVLRKGMVYHANGKNMTIKGIEYNHKDHDEAPSNTDVGLSLTDADIEFFKSIKNTEITFVDSISAQQNMDHKGIYNATLEQQSDMKTQKPEGLFGFIMRLFRK